MWLFLFRNELQGLEKPLFPFLAGIAELVARVVICLFLPAWINGGAVSSDSSYGALLGAYAGDPGAWLLASLKKQNKITSTKKSNNRQRSLQRRKSEKQNQQQRSESDAIIAKSNKSVFL